MTTYFPDGMPGADAKEPLKLLAVIPPDLEDIAELASNESPSVSLVLNRALTPYEHRALHTDFQNATVDYSGGAGTTLTIPMPLHRLHDNPGGLAIEVADISKFASQIEAKHQRVRADYVAAVEAVNKTLG